MHAPSFDKSPLDQRMSERIARAWDRGIADSYPARTLVRAGVVSYHPLRGGIYYRREPVKYIILHSTETGIPVSAVNVIEGWSSMGRRHPGAQYVVDRDGTIYQAVDPDLATVHVNIFKTLPGINNDNSIGIEMNHTGRQNYPAAQREAVSKLLAYLQQRYQVDNANVVTHRYAQQGDHTDPVNFDLDGFLAYKNQFQKQAIAYKVKGLEQEVKTWNAPDPSASTMLQPHPAQKVEVIERVDKNLERTEKVKVDVSSEESLRNVQPVNGLELKGPIEVDPAAASDLNQKETFEVDGPGATRGGEGSETAKTEPKPELAKPKSSPAPDSTPAGKLSSPSGSALPFAPAVPVVPVVPVHKFAPAHTINSINQNPRKEINQVTHKEVNQSVRRDISDSPLTQFVPGDKPTQPRVAPVQRNLNSAQRSVTPAPKALAQKVPIDLSTNNEQKEAKPAARKSIFQRMRTYLKENLQ
jgi:hypothetical protein